MFDGISGCLVALKQLGLSVDSYVSSESDQYSKIVTMVRHPEVVQVGDTRRINTVLRKHGPFDLLVAGLPCDDFEHYNLISSHKAGMHFEIFVEIRKLCAEQHKKVRKVLRIVSEHVSMAKTCSSVIYRSIHCSPFIDASTHLYKRVCPSVRGSVMRYFQ